MDDENYGDVSDRDGFDLRFPLDWEYWVGTGTRPAAEWIDDLDLYQEVCGHGAVPPKRHVPFGPLAQWVNRMRRHAQGGTIPLETLIALHARGVIMVQDGQKRASGRKQEEAHFRAGMDRLHAFLGESVEGEIPDLTYALTRANELARKCYTFLEHMTLKRRQRCLSDEHYHELIALPMTVNGKSMQDRLTPSNSLRGDALGLDEDAEDLLPDGGVYVPLAFLRDDLERRWKSSTSHLYLVGQGIYEVTALAFEEDFVRCWLADDGERLVYVSAVLEEHPTAHLVREAAPGDAHGALLFLPRTTRKGSEAQTTQRAGPDTGVGKPLQPGERFGTLSIIERAPRPPEAKHSGHFYRCVCDCGNEVVLQRDYLVDRIYPTCGCRKQYDLSGVRYGRLIVMGKSRRSEGAGRNTEWKVRCDCGTETWVRAAALKSGKTRSCGCLRHATMTTGRQKRTNCESVADREFTNMPDERKDRNV